MKRKLFTLLITVSVGLSSLALATPPIDPNLHDAVATTFSVEKLNELNLLHDVAISPNGKWLVYGLKKGSRSIDDHLYLKNMATGKIQQLTSHEKNEHNVVWSEDSQSLYFLSARSGHSQIWKLALSGGEAKQITQLPLDINGFKVANHGKTFALTITVKPHCGNFTCTVTAQKHYVNQQHHTRVYDQLMVRHWNTWNTPFKEHLFIATLPESGVITQATDLISNWTDNIAGIDEVAIHPSGSSLVFSAKYSATEQDTKDHAWTTNFDLFEVDLTSYQLNNITKQNRAWDAKPVFSPNGRFLVYKSMQTPNYESDKFSLFLRDNVTGRVRQIASQWDRSVSEIVFGDDNKTLYVTAQDIGQKSIFAINSEFGDVRKIYSEGTNTSLTTAGDSLYFTRHTLDTPKDIFTIQTDGYGFTQLTEVNKDKLNNINFADYQQFSFKGWNNETVYGYWLKPANFEPDKKYPIAFLVHGGPQGSFGNMFHYRWNAQLWAAQGYGVVMIDFHGSIGYGQAFTDAIARDWGGKPLEDLQKGLKFIVKDQPWLDGNNACALGASYGGYMMNWIAGNWPDRFKCLVNHAGLFDMPSFYWSTEELWFPEHDLGGVPWRDANGKMSDDYQKFNPAAYIDKWQTPMLVIQGELDYRVPYTQSLGAFTTLQRKGIDSKLVMFKDEDHHIRQPDNLEFWYQQVFSWLAKHTKKQ